MLPAWMEPKKAGHIVEALRRQNRNAVTPRRHLLEPGADGS